MWSPPNGNLSNVWLLGNREKGSSHSVFFVIANDALTKLKSLTVTIVHSGCFRGSTYGAGALSVNLSASSSSMTQRAVGTVNQIRHNTEDQIGLFVLQHSSEDDDSILADSLFEMEITAASPTSLSVQANGTVAREIRCETQRDMAELVHTSRDLYDCNCDLAMLKKRHLLSCRKCELQGKLLEDAIEQRNKIESELEVLDLKLDFRDDLSDGGASVEAQIHSLKNEHEKLTATVSLRYESS